MLDHEGARPHTVQCQKQLTTKTMGYVHRRVMELLPLSTEQRRDYLDQIERMQRAAATAIKVDERDFELWLNSTRDAIRFELARVEASGGSFGRA